MAATASEYTNGTHAMKMNITFWVSSIPNHRMVSGISAATGRLRPNRASGAPAASTTGDDIYLGADVASAGYTLISTRRFFALFSGSAGSNGRSHPIPADAN